MGLVETTRIKARRRLAAIVGTLGVFIALLGGWMDWQILRQRDVARSAAAGLVCLEARFLTERAAPTQYPDLLADAARQGQFLIYAKPLYPERVREAERMLPGRRSERPRACARERASLKLQQEHLKVFDAVDNGRTYAIASVTGTDDSGTLPYLLEVALPYEDGAQRGTRWMLAVAVGVLALVGAGGAWWMVTYMDKRLAQLTSTLRRAAKGDFSTPAPSPGDMTELSQLSDEINNALRRIEDQLVTLGVASARAGHELLDPIVRARVRLGDLSELRLSRAALAEINDIDARLELAENGARAILKLTRSQPAPPAEVDLSSMVTELVATERSEVPDLDLSSTVAPDLWVMSHADLLRVMILNLLSNARKHGLPGTISLRLQRTTIDGSPAFQFEISNPAGAGSASAGDLMGLFTRHAEAHAAGYGMGLNTAQMIAMREGFRLGKTPSRDRFIIWIAGPALVRASVVS